MRYKEYRVTDQAVKQGRRAGLYGETASGCRGWHGARRR